MSQRYYDLKVWFLRKQQVKIIRAAILRMALYLLVLALCQTPLMLAVTLVAYAVECYALYTSKALRHIRRDLADLDFNRALIVFA